VTTAERDTLGWEIWSRTHYDIAHLLDSGERSEKRVLHVLELLRRLVPYDQCGLLEARTGLAPRVVLVPAAPPEEEAWVVEMLSRLFERLAEEPSRRA